MKAAMESHPCRPADAAWSSRENFNAAARPSSVSSVFLDHTNPSAGELLNDPVMQDNIADHGECLQWHITLCSQN
jgi:hypothetical protein